MNVDTSAHPLETALAVSLRFLLMVGVPLAVLMLIAPAPSPNDGLLAYSTVHLVVLQLAAFSLVMKLAPLVDQPWFNHVRREWLASAVSLVATVVGFAALLTLATSAAARYDPSMQFLQLLSSLDIAWVVAALFIGARKLWGRGVATLAGLVILLACVGSIYVYLDRVGFSESGGWIVDGQAMMTVVLPADMIAAVISVTVLLVAARAAQDTSQARPQS